jgi:hypothetical protein
MAERQSGRTKPVTEVDTPAGIHIGGNYYDEIEFVGETEKGKGMITVIRGRKNQGWTLRIQEWWSTPEGKWAPAKNGVSLPLDDSTLAELIAKGFE